MKQTGVIIIGSGFGGAIPALELVRAGCSVALLERGPWRDTQPVRHFGIARRAPLPAGRHFPGHLLHRLHHRWLPAGGLRLHRHGLMELFAGEGIRALCSSGVGGGSHVYAGLHARPLRADYWDEVADGLSRAQMEPHYRAVLALLDSRAPDGRGAATTPPLPADFEVLAPQRQPHWGYLLGGARDATPRPGSRAPADFSREGMFGSAAGGKTTLDLACLMPALEAGLQLHAECEVKQLQQLRAGGFLVTAEDGCGQPLYFQASRVLLAAGALNSVSLLLRSRRDGGLHGMPALGTGFGSNGDAMARWPVNTPGVDHTAAGVYERMFRHRDDATGPLFMQAGMAGLASIPMPEALRRRLRRDLFVAAMGEDAADGRISLEQGRLRIRYSAGNSPVFARIDQHFRALGHASGVPLSAPAQPITVHPLGGARAGCDPLRSVVDGRGQVHGIPGLFVTDAAALPAAPGSPPSLSIAAWARHVALGIAAAG